MFVFSGFILYELIEVSFFLNFYLHSECLLKKSHLEAHKYTPTQLGVTGSLLPKTIRDAPPNREVNRRKKKKIQICTKF